MEANMGNEEERIFQAYQRLLRGEWPEDILGEMPDFPNKDLVRWNAEDAIESILGEAAISRCYHEKVLGKSRDEWLRWYTVGRFRYGEVSRRSYKNADKFPVSILIAVLSAAISIALLIVLQC